ncbi:deoxynucleoside kinase [Alkalilimnicola ehrlichii]|uniref:Deoxynucleoside kinase n=1 Tax=Alkalilimnicola ehrlichii TaxID=351052 RepID=A0A3E0WYX6_9GAMM|nr:deoxynucleoside kinase [Alkalilimnicola ehrlichii]RFA30455.1 deoxynucleoside kinase [Alkalilimnicola ehrlichii]RFA38008.1 deoxynucleoside kinase [Alkalilimnicola ehrlichii]
MSEQELRHIVVEGPIGVGKTTLAKRLAASFGYDLLLEQADDNPFLERFYENPRMAAFPTQLYFLMQRAEQLRELRQGDMFQSHRVADFLFDKDRLFAELTLDEHEYALYAKVYNELAVEVPRPDLVIYLQAPLDVLMQRIAVRGIAYEQIISNAYLERLCRAYIEFFYHYEQSPLLIVNTSDINIVDSERDYAMLLERIRGINSGRHYFNPAPLGL